MRHLLWRVSAQDGHHLVLQAAAPIQNQYNDRHWDQAAQVCLCFCAGGVQGTTEIRSYFAYFAYIKLSHGFLFTDWVDKCQSAIVYERSEQAQVLYVIPVTSRLGQLPFVPVRTNGQ
jgi:hypothetical protein